MMSHIQICLLLGTVLFVIYIPIWFWVRKTAGKISDLEAENQELIANKDALNSTTTELINAEKFALIGKTYSALAHEINTPLGVVLNSAERIIKKQDQLPFEVQRDIDLIFKAALRAQVIIQRFLQSTRKKLNEDQCNICDVYSEWHSLYAADYTNQGISIESYLPDLSIVCVDNASAFQVLNNIIMNAIDAVHANHDKKEIRIISKTLENYLEVSIQDNGPGFPNNILDNSFKPFRSNKELGRGTGIGLWLVYNILREYGGQIELGNTVHGAVVNLYFPTQTPYS